MVTEVLRDEGLSLRKALRLAGCSRKAYYHQAKRRNIQSDPYIAMRLKEETVKRPLYGSRRMAAQLSRELGVRINRKRIQRLYRQLGWTQPQKSKNDLLRTVVNTKPKPSRPNELWEADLTYIHCGVDGWAYLFNVIDIFSREWVSYVFDTYPLRRTLF